ERGAIDDAEVAEGFQHQGGGAVGGLHVIAGDGRDQLRGAGQGAVLELFQPRPARQLVGRRAPESRTPPGKDDPTPQDLRSQQARTWRKAVGVKRGGATVRVRRSPGKLLCENGQLLHPRYGLSAAAPAGSG